jgi:proteasome lid subunit RPN8/RPN11
MRSISLTRRQVQELTTIAIDALPNEGCAFLLGDNDSAEKVAAIHPMQNIDQSPVSFSMDPAQVLDIYNHADNKGMQVTAIFHSHPAKPSPSSTDIRFMQINPVVWLIYSTTEYQLKAFVYDDDAEMVKEIAILFVDAKE